MLKKSIPILLYKDFLPHFVCNYSCPSIKTLSESKLKKPTSAKTKTSKFIIFCNTQITKNGRNGNLEAAESIFNRMPIKNVVSWTALLTAYSENGEIIKARKVFDEIPQRNTASWNAMITAYIRNSKIVEASELFSRIPMRNSISYTAMTSGFVRAGMLCVAEKMYYEMPPIGRDPAASNVLINGYLNIGELEKAVRVFEGMYERDVVSWSSILDGYCKKGRISEAREIFEKMPERNVVSWTTMIDGYLKIGRWGDGFEVFSNMRKECVAINSTTLTVFSYACADLGKIEEGIQIHGLVSIMGFEFDVFLGNSMITMYSRFGLMDNANKIFDLMSKRDLISWNSLIGGYVQNNGIEEAYEFFKKMPKRDAVSWTSMIVGFSKDGRILESIRLFKLMPEKDDFAWTTMISAFVSNEEYEQAFRWFIWMIGEEIKPNSLTLSSILSASACLAMLNQGLQIHAHVVKMDLEFDISIQNSLVSMYAKCGNVDESYRIFSGIKDPSLVSMNSMITGFALHGISGKALGLFEKMQLNGYEPNQITFLGILSACAHVGLVKEGWFYFKLMSCSYCIQPGPDHYTCMVDLLGRAGLLKEAFGLIVSMPFEPHSAVWGALLSASRTHLNFDLAKLAARNLFLLEPDNATPYVVLSAMYSLVGLKKDGEELRMVKRLKGVKKSPGCSWIIVNNKVNLFFASDRTHINIKEIHAALGIIALELEEVESNGMDSVGG